MKTYIPKLQEIAKVISEIDVLQSLAKVAEENGYVRPTICSDRSVKIIGDRHPVVEKVSSSLFCFK